MNLIPETPRFSEHLLFPGDFETHRELESAVLMLAEHLKLTFVRTNCTKHGTVELRLEANE